MQITEQLDQHALQLCRWPLVLPAWHKLLADGQMGIAQTYHCGAVTLHPASRALATVTA